MSNLDHDIREAARLGYGVHYGRYKADHPHTAKNQDDGPPEKTAKCAECGSLFVPKKSQSTVLLYGLQESAQQPGRI